MSSSGSPLLELPILCRVSNDRFSDCDAVNQRISPMGAFLLNKPPRFPISRVSPSVVSLRTCEFPFLVLLMGGTTGVGLFITPQSKVCIDQTDQISSNFESKRKQKETNKQTKKTLRNAFRLQVATRNLKSWGQPIRTKVVSQRANENVESREENHVKGVGDAVALRLVTARLTQSREGLVRD